MAEEDSELLDWGNEDDVVSLGDEEESYTLENLALPPQNSVSDAPPAASEARTPPLSRSPLPQDSDSSTGDPDQKFRSSEPLAETAKPTSNATPQQGHKLTILPRMTHALPPKPMTTSVPYVPPSDPSIVEATAMAVRAKKPDATTTHNLKDGSRQDHLGPLPVPWEVCIPRSGNGIYYHNSQTGQTQWDRPSAVLVVSPPATLSHDDRHYRPSDDRYSSHGRHYSNAPARSPKSHNRSRSTSPPPPSRDSRVRGNNQRPAKARTNTKTSVPQREHDAGDLPKVDDRHWVPSPPSSNNKPRSGRRQRRQNHSMDGRIADSSPEEADQLPPQRDTNTRNHNHAGERTYIPSDISSNRASAPRPATPPLRDERPIIHETKTDAPRESFQERRRSPGPTRDQRSPESFRRERPSRFGPGSGPGPSSTLPERGNGLPMKPVVTHSDRPGDVRRANSDRPYGRRVEQDRGRYEDPNPEDSHSTYATSATRSPILTRDQGGDSERSWVPAANGDRGMISSASDNSSSRKRPPLPPQEAEFRDIARPRSATYPEPINQRSEEAPHRLGTTFHDRDQMDRVANLPPSRSYPPREDARDVGYNLSPLQSRNNAPADYDRGRDYDRDHERDRPRPRQHLNEQEDFQRGYDRPVDTPPISDIRGGYMEREREPPSKPRAMQALVPVPSSVYTGPPNPGPASNRYHDRPSPPHLSLTDSRRDIDARPVQPASSWSERRDAKSYHPPSDRPPVREPRGRTVPTSSANSIPIGNKRVFTPAEPVVNDYHPPAPNDRYGRPSSYPTQEPPRPAKTDYPRSYPEPELVSDIRQKYPRTAREDSFSQAPPDDRAYARRDKIESTPRTHVLPPIPQPENPPRSRPTRFSSDSKISRFEHEPVVDLPTPKIWSRDDYDTSPRGRYRDDPVRDATPPPLSRETSFTSPQWDPPSSSSSLHDPHVYHEPPPPPTSRMDVDPPPSRQVPGTSAPYSAPVGGRYRREEADFREPARAPLPIPRAGNRRDQPPYSPEIQRGPIVPMNGVERGGGLMKRNPSNASFDDNPRNQRPWTMNKRHPLPPPPLPEVRAGRMHIQESHTDNVYNGEPLDPADTQQADYVPLPAKTFEQRLSVERPPILSGGASLLSRISRGDDIPPPPSLRDRVQIGTKRDRENTFRDHLPDRPLEVDDVEADYLGARRGKKRRRNRRGGPPS